MNLAGIGAGLSAVGNNMREKQQWDAQQAQIQQENEFKRQQLAIQQALADRQSKEYDRKVASEDFENSAKFNPTGWVDDPKAVALAGKAGLSIPQMNLTPPRINEIENSGGQDLTSIAGKFNIPPKETDNPLQTLERGEQLIPSGSSIDSKAVPSGVSPSTGVRIPEQIQQQRSMNDIMSQIRNATNAGDMPLDPNVGKTLQGEAYGVKLPAGAYGNGPAPNLSIGHFMVNGKSTPMLKTEGLSKGLQMVDAPPNVAPSFTPFPMNNGVGVFNNHTGRFENSVAPPKTNPDGSPLVERPDSDATRNLADAKTKVTNTLDVLDGLSKRVITKVGPAQRAAAAMRGWDTVMGNDPDYKVYRDARRAFAVNLAVILQQGGRPSDNDTEAALGLIPDAFSDTSQSAPMKWSIIRKISGIPDSSVNSITNPPPPTGGGARRGTL